MKIIKENFNDKEKTKGIYREKSGGWIFEKEFINLYSSKISESSEFIKKTQEVRLSDLGVFPLEEKSQSIFSETVSKEDGTELKIPEILKLSKIPIFYSEKLNETVFISKEAIAVCRYFFHTWDLKPENFDLSESLNDDEKETIVGFFIIHSFTGGEIK